MNVASSQEQIVALRADVNELRAQVEALSRTVAALAEDVSDARAYAKNAPAVQSPQAGGETPWWHDQRIESALEDLHEDVGLALGEMVGKVRDELEQQTSASKRDHELLRRACCGTRSGSNASSMIFVPRSRRRSVRCPSSLSVPKIRFWNNGDEVR